MSDETTIIWHPSLRIFIKHSILAGMLFSLAVNLPVFVVAVLGLQWIGLPFLLITLPISALYYALVFDDFSVWNRIRHDEWKLTTSGLSYRNADDSEGFLSMQLRDIQKVKRSFWRGVIVRVSDGKAFSMSYLSDPKTVQQTILDRMPEGASS